MKEAILHWLKFIVGMVILIPLVLLLIKYLLWLVNVLKL